MIDFVENSGADGDAVASFAGPAGPAPRGTLIVVPGRGESSGVYTRFGTRLASDAYPVHVIAAPTRDEALARAQIATIVNEDSTPRPIVLVGSDAGALFAAALLASEDRPEVDGLVLAGWPGAGDAAAPAAAFDDELSARTTCPTHRARLNDGLVAPGALYDPVPPAWQEAAALAEAPVPILALHGEEDPITPLEWAREAYASAPSAQFVTIAGGAHDVLNDQHHRSVAATIVLWLEQLRRGAGVAPIVNRELVGADLV
jgi:alpha-beta hydrolase superfamily lysophospholipase